MKRTPFLLPYLLLLMLLSRALSAQDLYWGDPEVLTSRNTRFPQAAGGGGIVALVWQEFSETSIYLGLRVSKDMSSWNEYPRILGPFAYAGSETPVFSLLVDTTGGIFIAVAGADKRIDLFYSADQGRSFQQVQIFTTMTVVSPKLFMRQSGSILLFVSNDAQDSLTIFYSDFTVVDVFQSGVKTQLKPFVPQQPLVLNFLPAYATFAGREYIAYQSRDKGQNEFFQIYLKASNLQGEFDDTSRGIVLTQADEIIDGVNYTAKDFENQRPYLFRLTDRLALCWERNYYTKPPQIYYMELDKNGAIITQNNRQSIRITSGAYNSLYPQGFIFKDNVYLIWFDNRRGESHIIMAARQGSGWVEKDLSRLLGGDSIYPWAVQEGGRFNLYWENRYRGTSRLISLAPDQFVAQPKLKAVNFTPGIPSRNTALKIQWNIPQDTSGIEGYSFVWSQNPQAAVPHQVMLRTEQTAVTLTAETDGPWYFFLSAKDYADNWSQPVLLEFKRDTKPPGPVLINPLPADEAGFLPTNNLSLTWSAPAGESEKTIAGYTYNLTLLSADLGQDAASFVGREFKAGTQVNSFAPEKSYDNLENGIWAFSLAAIDKAQNWGEVTTVIFKLNKYIPVTRVYTVTTTTSDIGDVDLGIRGRGFTADGHITTVFIDRDGLPPYDYMYGAGDFVLASNNLIIGPRLVEYEEGTYRVGLIHGRRGVYLTPIVLELSMYGTVKVGIFEDTANSLSWQKLGSNWQVISANNILIGTLLLMLGFAFVFAFRKLLVVAGEGRVIRTEVMDIIKGELSQPQKEKIMKRLKTKGLGLRFKFTALITILVIIIVLMISVPLSYTMIQIQKKNLAEGLYQSTKVLLGSLSAGSEQPLQDRDSLNLAVLTEQISAMNEAQYAIITSNLGLSPGQTGLADEYVWAVSKPEVLAGKISGEYIAGVTSLNDAVTPVVGEISTQVNDQAVEEVGGLNKDLADYYAEFDALRGKSGEAVNSRIEELGNLTAELQNRIVRTLRSVASQIGSVPVFDIHNLQKDYIFYRPIVFRREGQDIYYRGLVRVGISAENILKEIDRSINNLIMTIGLIALIAIGLGTLGALLLASITIQPIRKLVAGVATIRDTDDKERLKDHVIDIKQQDEIRMLADTVNQMTQGLVKAAAANKELIVGKEVQKMFIPLDKDDQGKKGSTGKETTNLIEIFGYYEGAKGVSGDYFDFKKLDDKHYAMIKCDIAGKGVSASLIMVEVATLFTAYFRDWTLAETGIRLDKLAYTINDMIEERGFKGRFAALIIGILNVENGDCYLCNAGDNIIHVYDSQTRQMTQHKLPECPAAGVFPSMLIEMQSGFKQVKIKLKRGDTLFLFTDGIEEAQRVFRDHDYNVITCSEPDLKDGESHGGTHAKGSDFEEFGIPRIYAIINCVFNRGAFQLAKYHNPNPRENLDFNFKECEGTVEEVVLALIAVEKVFRLFADPKSDATDHVVVDTRVDGFLQKTFTQYSLFFSRRMEKKEEDGYTSFAQLKEDSQYDDLTILAIQKK